MILSLVGTKSKIVTDLVSWIFQCLTLATFGSQNNLYEFVINFLTRSQSWLFLTLRWCSQTTEFIRKPEVYQQTWSLQDNLEFLRKFEVCFSRWGLIGNCILHNWFWASRMSVCLQVLTKPEVLKSPGIWPQVYSKYVSFSQFFNDL